MTFLIDSRAHNDIQSHITKGTMCTSILCAQYITSSPRTAAYTISKRLTGVVLGQMSSKILIDEPLEA